MGPVKSFGFSKAFTYDVGTNCHPAAGFQFFLLLAVSDLHYLSMDPPMGWFQDLVPLASLRVGCGESIGPVVEEIRVLGYSTVPSSARKRVVPRHSVVLPPNLSCMLNLTCSFAFFSTGMGVLPCHSLLLNSQALKCSFRSLVWRQNHSLAGLDLGD